MSIRLRAQENTSPILNRAFLIAAEAIEAAVHHGDKRPDQGFHRISASVAFHLARYSARAYSMLPKGTEANNLALTEIALMQLLRRKIEEMYNSFSTWLLDSEHSDEQIANRLDTDENFDEVDAIHNILTTSYMRGLALFSHAITTGLPESAAAAKKQLIETAEAASDLHEVSHWWTATLTYHLIDELWQLSMYQQIPELTADDKDKERWSILRQSYIQCLRTVKKYSVIEFWPSQLAAVYRAVDLTDDMVVALPTSAGKTRIAELCILRALAAGQRVVYVTPLRALSAQVERDLSEIFLPLGFSVSSLYGSAGVEIGDAETLRKGKIVVSTPEKLDFALRNDQSVINSVGLIVLDEGHMLGPNEREVRYEALVQRLLRRADASTRRIVCMSALFPTPEEMSDLVSWIRQDNPGDPVYSTWRPTRQRFGILNWISDAARLDFKVEGENPFVPGFIKPTRPPDSSPRRKLFPCDKHELTLAAAWSFVEQDKQVLIYCSERRSVEPLGKHILKCIEHDGVLAPLCNINERIRNAMTVGAEWLGEEHPAVRCLQYGVALHHGGLPRPFLNEVERLLRSGECLLTIASPTLAQGLNLSASVLLVPSIWRNRNIINPAEFANVAGRAGRAFVDIEGLVLHVVWEKTMSNANHVIQNWENLVNEAKAPQVVSGILLLAVRIYNRIAQATGIPINEVLDYLTGHEEAWNFNETTADRVDVSAAEWERDIASLDSAILALLNAETLDSDISTALEGVLDGSLFSRHLRKQKENTQKILRGFVVARAHRIWSQTQEKQRKGYHAAGIGLAAGLFLDANFEELVRLLRQSEDAVISGDANATAAAIVAFATLIFQTAPFQSPKDLPTNWQDALSAWMLGRASAEVISICGDDGVDLLQEAFTYRLPWAMEAVRVHALAVGYEGATDIIGLAAMAVEAGSSNRSVIVLMHSGLSSREAAIAAVISTGATFEARGGMLAWIKSDEVKIRTVEDNWPTKQSRHAWLQFYEDEMKGTKRKWKRETQQVRVEWIDKAPKTGTHVIIHPGINGTEGFVLSPSFVALGKFKSSIRHPRKHIVSAQVGTIPGTVDVEYFGPSLAL